MTGLSSLDSLLDARPPGSDQGAPIPLAPDLAWMRTGLVNVAFLGLPEAGDRGWVLVDAGIPGFADAIATAAAKRFGPDARPAGIVLTHGHFDHVGSLRALAERWDAPIWAHRLELPYLTGKSAYPPPDPTVGGGAMARLSLLYPKGPIHLGTRVHALPEDGTVPGAPEWRWHHTPGHAPGHVSLFRERDRALVAGDAFVTTKQESFEAVWSQRSEVHGPPMYFTPDWDAARESVRLLAELEPDLAVTGHGRPMRGHQFLHALQGLAEGFDEVARPREGRYRDQPAVADERGVVSVPPPVPDATTWGMVGAAVVTGILLGSVRRER